MQIISPCFFLLVLCSLVLVVQAQDSSCLSQIVPCLQFINSKKTPSTGCCTPLKSLIRSDAQCLCSLLGSGSSKTNQGGVNVSHAHLLSARCGEKVNVALCKRVRRARNKMKSSVGKLTMGIASGVAVPLLVFLLGCN